MQGVRSRVGGLLDRIVGARVAPALLGLALLLNVGAFAVGWFNVNTGVKAYQYDPADPEGKGTYCVDIAGQPFCNLSVDLDMHETTLKTTIKPTVFQQNVESTTGLPTYEEHAGNTGTQMRGVFFLHLVGAAALAAAVGFFVWHLRSRRDFGPSVWRFAVVFGILTVLAFGFLVFAVPGEAQADVREILQDNRDQMEANGLPEEVDPDLFNPDVEFWNTWVCCPPVSHFPVSGQEILVVVTTKSRPGTGFYFAFASMVLTAAGLGLAQRAGQLEPKPVMPATEEILHTAPPPKAVG